MYRDGLMILAEINLPLRRRNFATLQIGTTLIRHQTRYHIEFQGSEMKNGSDFEGWYPESLTYALDYYVDNIRPILRAGAVEPDQGWFWLSRGGEPMVGQPSAHDCGS